MSTAYYALFHFLVDRVCRSMLGASNDRRPFRHVLTRAFQHEAMASACKSFAGGTLPAPIKRGLPANFGVPVELRRVAHTFRQAQEERHLADYDLTKSFVRSDVLALIRDVEQAITVFDGIRSRPDAKFFLACLLTWKSLTSHR